MGCLLGVRSRSFLQFYSSREVHQRGFAAGGFFARSSG
nr:MAG TPA: hypothetical protein [Caudoviricetes sp.]